MKDLIIVDLEGVLLESDGNFRKNHFAPLKPNAKEFLKETYKKFDIRLFTNKNLQTVEKWLIKNRISEYIFEISNSKD